MGDTADCRMCHRIANAESNPRWVASFDRTIAMVDARQTFPGRTTLLVKNHYVDMLVIPDAEYAAINNELRVLAKAIQTAFVAPRMNYANYGNVVPHQHWHVTPRYEDDPCWGGPPIQLADVEVLPDQRYEEIAAKIRSAL